MVRMVTAEKTVWSGTGQCWFVLGETSVFLVFLCLCLCNRLCLCICVPLPFLDRYIISFQKMCGFELLCQSEMKHSELTLMAASWLDLQTLVKYDKKNQLSRENTLENSYPLNRIMSKESFAQNFEV